MYTSLTCWMNTARDYVTSSIGTGKTKRKRLTYLAIGSVSALTISYLINYVRIQSRNKENAALDPYFSSIYHKARDKFRNAASKISIAKQHAIIIDTEADLSIDLCYIPGDKQSEHVILHFSGTHGVEGYSGSAIQIYLLQNKINNIINNKEKRPHIVFIHTLNPYGMAYNRRWNKANIDLNRNCILNRDLWNQVRNRDPNKSGYKDLDHMLNPSRKPTWIRDDVLFWWDTFKNIMIYGMEKLQRTTVEGQYFKKSGIFYGGKDIAIEHDMLIQFITQESPDNDQFAINLCQIAKKLTIIDVHTGLGEYSLDYLWVDHKANELNKLFPNHGNENRIIDINSDSFMRKMYIDSVGSVTATHGYLSLFTNSIDTLSMTQEFGTVAPIQVFKALRAENMAYHYSQGESLRDEQIFYHKGLDVKQVFYLETDPFWKTQVIKAGVDVFLKSLWR